MRNSGAADENIRGAFFWNGELRIIPATRPTLPFCHKARPLSRIVLALRLDSAFAGEIAQVIVDGWRWSARIRMRQRRLALEYCGP